ncbi:MAG: histidinol-phosphate transaminase [Actinomycetota bacterium]|nr:histidinol-phosphate transaminase [Actinomycetota bacterium]
MSDWVRKSLEQIEAYRAGRRASEVKGELGLSDIIKLSSNESPFAPVRQASRAMGQALKGLNRYPDGDCRLLKSKLAANLDVAYETLMVGNGSNELIRLLAQVILEPGDEVIMAAPSFVVYPIVTAIMSAMAVEVPLKGLAHDLDAMAAAITPKTKLIFVCNPNNPTGTVVPAADCGAFLESVPGHVLVCFDEAYHEFVSDFTYGTALELRGKHENIIVLRTFSKIYGLAGARVGYGMAPPAVVEAIDKVREPFNVNLLGQIGAYYSLDGQPEIRRRAAVNRTQRELVESALDRLGLERAASQANFVYFDPRMPAAEAFDRLARHGVIVRAFRHGDHIRATLGSPKDNLVLINALGTLKTPP